MKKFIVSLLKDPPFYYALIIASMFVASLIGNIGILLYYPMLFFLCFFYNGRTKNNIGSVWGIFLTACVFSVLFNTILPVFKAPYRLAGYSILIFAVTPILFNVKKAVMCFKLLQYTCLLLVAVGFLNYYMYRTGALEISEGNRVFAGTIGTNFLGMLCSMAILYLGSLLLYQKALDKILIYLFYILLIGLLLCLLLSSSRNSIVSIIISTLVMVYIKFQGKIGSTLAVFAILAILAVLTFPLWEEYIVGILDKQGGNTDSFDMHSREAYWATRWKEFISSPIFGIGFASVSNPTPFSLMTGIVETTTGWGGLFSQLGLIGGIPFCVLTIQNMKYLLTCKDGRFVHCLLGALLSFFCINSIGEGYITTVGCQFTVYFFLTQGVVYVLRKKWISVDSFVPLFLKSTKI
ncbi:hypothetical protein E5358_08575 [Palleniella muris]|uniref:Uncharacterized protein n=1 Tax=Palleniella muris TaxID=3038145 RepID=A0AC61QQ71_9BACT|nr:O-antigen ligase family protein [Palleniella muris]TGX82103.1 hypothetical protein E5358_08575 [Palleniella muris]